MIHFIHRGNFKNTERLFSISGRNACREILEKYGQLGVDALSSATPKDSGKTSASWGYEIVEKPNGYSICWTNSNINNGVNIAVILQYGHGTKNGGYVKGTDYINPAILPVFLAMADEAWKEVIN